MRGRRYALSSPWLLTNGLKQCKTHMNPPVIALVLMELFLIILINLEKGPGLGPLLSTSEMRKAWMLMASMVG